MLDILLLPERRPFEGVTASLLRQSLQGVGACGCEKPWLRVLVADRWMLGKIDAADLEACCSERLGQAMRASPWLFDQSRPTWGSPRTAVPAEPVRVLLFDCQIEGDMATEDGALVGTAAPETYGEAIVVQCEPGTRCGGQPVQSLLVHPIYMGDRLETALRGDRPVEVAATWRRNGLDWTPASIHAAQTQRLGGGGTVTGKLVPLRGPLAAPRPAAFSARRAGASG